MIGQCLRSKFVELPRLGVLLDPCIEHARFELVQPGAQTRDLIRRERLNGFLYFLELGHEAAYHTRVAAAIVGSCARSLGPRPAGLAGTAVAMLLLRRIVVRSPHP